MRKILMGAAVAAALLGAAAPASASALNSTNAEVGDCRPSLDSEVYQGKLIIISDRCDPGPVVRRAVFIEFRELIVYRTEDGEYYSRINAYELFPNLLETARAAVRTLGDEKP